MSGSNLLSTSPGAGGGSGAAGSALRLVPSTSSMASASIYSGPQDHYHLHSPADPNARPLKPALKHSHSHDSRRSVGLHDDAAAAASPRVGSVGLPAGQQPPRKRHPASPEHSRPSSPDLPLAGARSSPAAPDSNHLGGGAGGSISIIPPTPQGSMPVSPIEPPSSGSGASRLDALDGAVLSLQQQQEQAHANHHLAAAAAAAAATNPPPAPASPPARTTSPGAASGRSNKASFESVRPSSSAMQASDSSQGHGAGAGERKYRHHFWHLGRHSNHHHHGAGAGEEEKHHPASIASTTEPSGSNTPATTTTGASSSGGPLSRSSRVGSYSSLSALGAELSQLAFGGGSSSSGAAQEHQPPSRGSTPAPPLNIATRKGWERKVGFDTMPDATETESRNFSFTLQARTKGYVRTKNTRTFMCAVDDNLYS